MKRQLNKIEIDICKRSIMRFQDEITDLDYLLADAELKYNRGLEYSYKKQKKQYKEAIDQIKEEINQKNKQIEVLSDQIKNGVSIKENDKNKDKGGYTE